MLPYLLAKYAEEYAGDVPYKSDPTDPERLYCEVPSVYETLRSVTLFPVTPPHPPCTSPIMELVKLPPTGGTTDCGGGWEGAGGGGGEDSGLSFNIVFPNL